MTDNLRMSVLVFAFILATEANAQTDEQKALESFERLVANIVDYGEKTVSPPRPHKAGGVAKFKWHNNIKPTYDIKKSDSIVTPYVAVLTISGATCATSPATSPEQIVDAFSCPKSDTPAASPIMQSYRLQYKRGKWLLSGAKVDIPLFGRGSQGSWDNTNFLAWLFNAESIALLQE